ncbi:hypothetical protein RclHR1_02700023 [Rhizophagus clarus]|uniref:Putative 50S ribosomal protein L19 n=1 Tax=Rhizophagus clarus TaxID=94130 RepID=A0A2Z6RH44_9GLOM|nr:hypothetical protein RclHR1_02700023 [Rhizophagus clarus]GES93886.1 putative 50S ribosomal protein L19 [Rhizophagus clarus]
MLKFSKKFCTPSFSLINHIKKLSNNPQATTYEPPGSILIPKQFSEPLINNKNVMEVINYENRNKVSDDRFKLFAKHGKDRIKTGDVLLVESYTSMSSIKNSSAKSSTTAFAGICICIRRRGVDTNFTLRNIILKVGVEQRFSINSPLIKSIKILSRGEGYRRAKLFYLRDQPGKAFQISDLLKRERERKEVNSKQSTNSNNNNK